MSTPACIRGRLLLVLVVLLGPCFAAVPGSSHGREGRDPQFEAPFAPGEILVKFKPGASPSERAAARAALGGERLRKFRSGAEHWRAGRGLDTGRAIEILRRNPHVAYAEPNYIVRADVIPNDPHFPALWGLKNTGQDAGIPGSDIDAERAWDVATGSPSVVVGVIDTGIDYNHPDLAANIWTNPGEVADNGVDDDGNGFVDDIHGWDFINEDNDPFDDQGHGTHVAGTIGALGNNGAGTVGVAWRVSLMALKFLDATGAGTTANAITAIEYATMMRVPITNNSWGGGAFTLALLDAINEAGAEGSLFVAAAGNSSLDNDTFPHYPSSYDAPNIVSVAATDSSDGLASFSNYGRRSVDLGAPGVGILSTVPGGYDFKEGTSVAAPHVAGAAALLLALTPVMDVRTLKQALLDSADPLGALENITVSGGRLNAYQVVTSPDGVPPAPITDLAVTDVTSNTVFLRWTATGGDGDLGRATAYDLRYATTPLDEATFASAPKAPGVGAPGPPGAMEAFEVQGLDPLTSYYFAVKALDEWGQAGAISNVEFATTLPPPAFASSPRSFAVSLLSGQTATRLLAIENAGAGTLDWRIPAPETGGGGGAAPWLSASPAAGRLPAGDHADVVLTFDAQGVAGGVYTATLLVESNDPFNPLVPHEARLEVTDAPAIRVAPGTLDFGPVNVGYTGLRSLAISNTGTRDLTVRGITADDPALSVQAGPFALSPGATRNVNAVYSPTSATLLAATITVASDASNAPLFTVAAAGAGLPAPGVTAAPAFFTEILRTGQSAPRTLRITNASAAPVTVSLAAELGPLDASGGSAGTSGAGAAITIGSPASPFDVAASSLMTIDFVPAPSIINGGFEQGTSAGWTAEINGPTPSLPWLVSAPGGGWFHNSRPSEGRFDILNGFDGEAGVEYTLSQEIALPVGTLGAVLTWHDRIQFDSLGSPSTQPRIYEALILDEAGAALAVALHEEIWLDGMPYTDLGWQRRTADLTPFRGRTIRFVIREFIPETFTGPATIEFDGFRIEAQVVPEWLTVAPGSAVIPPGASHDFTATLDAGGSGTNLYHGAVRIDTDLAGSPTLRVPAVLGVIGEPDIEILGEAVAIYSGRDYRTDGATTSIVLPITAPPVGEGRIALIAEGDFTAPDQTATLVVEGMTAGTVGSASEDCGAAAGAFTLGAADLAALASDGAVTLEIRNAPTVEARCYLNRHRVRLTYRMAGDRVEFGSVFAGGTAVRRVVVANTGSDPLFLTSVTTDAPEFSAAPSSLTIPPGDSQEVTLTFTPTAAGPITGSLAIASTDPDEPLVSVPLAGTAEAPPVLHVEPPALAASVPAGTTGVRPITITNEGASPLEISLSARPRTVPGSVQGGTGNCRPFTSWVSEFSGPGMARVDLQTGAFGHIDTGLKAPNRGLALNAEGTVAYVTDSFGGSLAAVDLIGGGSTPVAAGLDFPNGLALNAARTIAYVTDSITGELVAVDLATGSWTTVAAGLAAPNGIALDATGRRMLVAEYLGDQLSEVDLTTGTVRILASGLSAPSSVALSRDGTTAYVAEAASGEVSSVDLATGLVSRIVSKVGFLGSIAVDPSGTRLYATQFNTGRVVAADISTGAVTQIASNLPNPIGIVLVTPPECTGTFMRVSPATGTLAPGSSLEVQALFDAASLIGGSYGADVDVLSNDPAAPRLTIPADLTVIGTPDIAVSGGLERLESARSFTVSATGHLFQLDLPPLATAGAQMELIADGDFGDPGETASISTEGIPLGLVGAIGTDCSAAIGEFHLSPDLFAAVAADGRVEVEVVNSALVGIFCPTSRHTVRLAYRISIDPLDFGSLFLDRTATRNVAVDNAGTGVLSVASITSDRPEFSVSSLPFTLPPGGTQLVPVTFTAAAPGPVVGTLRIASDDPDTPEATVTLLGTGLIPPEVSVSPAALSASLLWNTSETRSLTIGNSGGSPLEFEVSVRFQPAATTPAPSRKAAPEAGESAIGSGADFTDLAPSPSPLTCVVEDQDAGLLYGQADKGTEFYRYVAALDRWEEIAPALVPALNNGGATLLDGRIYTAYPGNDAVLGVYDIAADAWSTIPNPLGRGTGMITSDGAGSLYLAHYEMFVRLDPASGIVTALAPPPFPMEGRGGLRFLDGVLYGHRGNGTTDFAAYDVAADQWRRLPNLPSGAVLGAAIDPRARTYVTYGSYGANNLYRYSLGAGLWSVDAIPSFSVGDGGMGWLPSPVPGVLFVQGQSGNLFARAAAVPFLTVTPSGGSVPAGGAVDLEALFDASDAPPGDYVAEIRIESNDPVTPLVTIPASLTIIGAPDMTVLRPPITLGSTSDYAVSGATTVHTFTVGRRTVGGGSFEIDVDGDYGDSYESVTLSAEGQILGRVGTTGADCAPAGGHFRADAAAFAEMAADGLVEVELRNSADVGVHCSVNRHTVRLTWREAADQVDFGTIFTGYSAQHEIIVENRGTAVLAVDLVSTDLQEFTASTSAFDLAPGASESVTVTFAPNRAGSFAGTLSIHGSDPDTPEGRIALLGAALLPPVAGVDPPSFSSTLRQGEQETRTLGVGNTGGSDLEVALSVRTDGFPLFVNLGTSSGGVPPGGLLAVDVVIDASGLAPGDYTAAIDVASNDPVAPLITVPVALRVRGIPAIHVSGEPVVLESSQDFTTAGARTVHWLRRAPPPAGEGLFEVAAVGDFGDPDEMALVTAELYSVGLLGMGQVADCQPTSAVFAADAEMLIAVLADGLGIVTFQNTLGVEPICPVNRHTVRLSYRKSPDLLEFGPVFVGGRRAIEILVENLGNDVLEVASIISGRPEFAASVSSMSLDPGASAMVEISFEPSAEEAVEAFLIIRSSDPVAPEVYLMMTGSGVPPPVASVDPASLRAILPPDAWTTRTVRIANSGLSDLEWELEAAPLPSWITVSPASGTVAPGAADEAQATIDARGLADGDHDARLVILTNDPVRTRFEVEVFLRSGWLTLDRLRVTPSTLNIGSRGRTVLAQIQLPPPHDPRDILLETLSLGSSMGTVPAIPSSAFFGDGNRDGVLELHVRFDRRAVAGILPKGSEVEVAVTGLLRDTAWFRGTTTVRAIGGRAPSPDGAEERRRARPGPGGALPSWPVP